MRSDPNLPPNLPFEIAIQTGVGSFLLNPDGSTQPTAVDELTVVGFGVDCLTAAHCNDNNECTIDSCVSYTCQYTPVSAGVACDDGLWCTHGGSTCDGNGLCSGGNPRCQPGELCLEASQQCLADLPPAPE